MIITFQPLQESHFPLLLKWLETPHVKAWWDPEVRWTPELIKEKYESYVQGYKLEQGIKKPLQTYVIYVDDSPIGYIQLYNAHDFPQKDKASLAELSDSLAGLDVFIGEEDFLGKGLGSRIIKQFLEEYVDPYYNACFVDPNTTNIKAIRAYEKAGFKKIKIVKDGTVTWMMRGKNMSAGQLIFTTTSTPKWDKKIAAGLRKECSSLTDISEDFKPHTIYGTLEDKFVGGIVLEQHGNILWIDALWVETSFRNHGIGKQLMEKANQFATQNNATEIQLNTYFKEAHDFFLSCGFEDVAVIPNWKYGLECYLMRRKI